MSDSNNKIHFIRLNQTRNKTLKKSNTKEKISTKSINLLKNFCSSRDIKRYSYFNNQNNLNNNSNNFLNNFPNSNKINNGIINNNQIILHPDKRSLFLRKINLNEKNNLYFKVGVEKIFNDKNLFLENKYKGKSIVIGKSKQYVRPPSFAIFSNRPSSKIMGLSRQARSRNKTRSVSRKNTLNPNNSSYSFINTHFYGKKYYARRLNKNDNEEIISDERLKNIYQEFLDREINNKAENKTINIIGLSSEKKKKIKKNDITLAPNKINRDSENILYLQNQILNNYKQENNEKEKIMDRLLKLTSKNNNNDLLMANLINYRIKKEAIEENDNMVKTKYSKNLNEYEFSKKIQWLESLRNYKIKKKNRNNNLARCKSVKSYSFGIRDNNSTVLNLSHCFNPLFAHASPKIAEYDEKVRDTLSENKANNGFMSSTCYDFFKKRKNVNLYSGLNIKGKKLLDFEIELSKELEGKKKKILHYNYRDEDISPKIFAISYSVNNFDIPKSVRNTLDLHIYKEKNV